MNIFFSCEIVFSALSPSPKIDFWPFLKWQKMELQVKKIIRKIDLFDFTSFFALDFLNFSGLLCLQTNIIVFVYKNENFVYVFFLGMGCEFKNLLEVAST